LQRALHQFEHNHYLVELKGAEELEQNEEFAGVGELVQNEELQED
jgi:hypothetical protein